VRTHADRFKGKRLGSCTVPMPRSIPCGASSLGSNDSYGTNNSRIVLGIHSLRCNAKNFFVSPRPCISPRHKPSRRASAASDALGDISTGYRFGGNLGSINLKILLAIDFSAAI
jgi:hypothetical protein